MKKACYLLIIFTFIAVLPLYSALNFASGSATIPSSSYADLDSTAEEIKDYISKEKNAIIKIYGHTDGSGKRINNIKLSLRRATAVRDYFITKHKISEDIFEIEGFGPDQPMGTNKTAEGRKNNRRVEVTVGKKTIVLSGAKPTATAVPIAEPDLPAPVNLKAEKVNDKSFKLTWEGDYDDYHLEVSDDKNFGKALFSGEVDENSREISGNPRVYYSRVKGIKGTRKSGYSNIVKYEIEDYTLFETDNDRKFRIGFNILTGLGFPSNELAEFGNLSHQPAKIGVNYVSPMGIIVLIDANNNRVYQDEELYGEFGTFSFGIGYEFSKNMIRPYAAAKGLLAEILIEDSQYTFGYGAEIGARWFFMEHFALILSGDYLDAGPLRNVINISLGFEIYTYK